MSNIYLHLQLRVFRFDLVADSNKDIEDYGSTPKNIGSGYYDVDKSFNGNYTYITLNPPTLNITMYLNLTQNIKDQNLVWMYSGDQYTQEYISAKEHGLCQSTEVFESDLSMTQTWASH